MRRPISIVMICASLVCLPRTIVAASLGIGLNFTSNIGVGSDSPGDPAPDAMGAVGPDAIVTLLNGQYAVFRKSDGALLASDTLDGFWAAAGHAPLSRPFDPRLIYDPGSARFFAVAVDWFADEAPADLLVAVSNSSDPTDGWSAFAMPISASAVGADLPGLGVDADGVYVTASKAPSLASALLVIPKADLVSATPTVQNATRISDLPPNRFGFIPMPVTDLDGGGLPTKLITATVEYFGVVAVSTLSGPVTAPTLTPDPLLLVPPMLKPPDARQPDAPSLYQDNGQILRTSVVRRDGTIWAVHTVGVGDRAALEWFQFDATTAAILQSGLIADPALDLIDGSIAVNEFGQIVIGFAATSESMFPSAFAVLGETIGGTTTFGDPVLLKAGTSSTVNRLPDGRNIFSDVSATVVDPDDPHVFWTFQQFGPGLGEDYWGVQVTQIHVVPEPSTTVLVALGLVALGRLTPWSGRRSR